MEETEKKLFRLLNDAKYKEDDDLANNIWQKIVSRNKRILRIKMFVCSVLGITSLGGFVPAWNILRNNMVQTGFFEYFSLLNTQTIFAYWKEFVFSIAESLPIMSITLFLSLLLIFFWSIKYLLKIINNNSVVENYGI